MSGESKSQQITGGAAEQFASGPVLARWLGISGKAVYELARPASWCASAETSFPSKQASAVIASISCRLRRSVAHPCPRRLTPTRCPACRTIKYRRPAHAVAGTRIWLGRKVLGCHSWMGQCPWPSMLPSCTQPSCAKEPTLAASWRQKARPLSAKPFGSHARLIGKTSRSTGWSGSWRPSSPSGSRDPRRSASRTDRINDPSRAIAPHLAAAIKDAGMLRGLRCSSQRLQSEPRPGVILARYQG
jgi:hypothetical protein